MMKYTTGPLTVRISNSWPYNIETFNSAGKVVFSRDLPCHSTGHKNAKEAMTGVDMPADWKAAERNAQALADEVLRAAAPELLESADRQCCNIAFILERCKLDDLPQAWREKFERELAEDRQGIDKASPP